MGRQFIAAMAVLMTAVGVTGCATPVQPAPLGGGHDETALDRYVKAPDSNYRYSLDHSDVQDGYTTYVVDMTSQEWLRDTEVDRTLWHHWLLIVVPDEVRTNTGFLFIGGGSNGNPAPEEAPERLVAIARTTNSVVSQLYMVPNQPLTFIWDETRPRWEDAAIAYTWDKYLRTGDDRWPMRLPMTKSAVRAMDTITSFCGDLDSGGVSVTDFVVSGGSKRGWTTWTTAAVDERVVAISPVVIDMLNVEESFKHHFEVYGRYARAVKDYEDMNIMAWQGTQEYRNLLEIVEPYEYRHRLTMPKYIVNSAGDQFFLPDSSQFYFDELKGEKYLRYVPNSDHGLGGTDAGESILAWYHAIVNDVPRPEFSWSFEEDGSIRVSTKDMPSEVRLWRATNPDARNFQKRTIGDAWSSTLLPDLGGGMYSGRVTVPQKGWTAFFVEMTYPSGTVVPFKFTTAVRVLPDVKEYTYTEGTPKDRRKKPKHR